jgi:hypothetical protein
MGELNSKKLRLKKVSFGNTTAKLLRMYRIAWYQWSESNQKVQNLGGGATRGKNRNKKSNSPSAAA